MILMGLSYPGYPLLGLLLTVLFTTGLAVVLGYAVFRRAVCCWPPTCTPSMTRSPAFLVALGFTPFNPVFSFGVGMFGIATLALLALLILRDPLWRERGREQSTVVEN